ncbi:transcription-repair coupling factor [Gammaproteobacteria bacterium]|nr:transcription-repair coupling factor [Gammaproteobacteria bacterium]
MSKISLTDRINTYFNNTESLKYDGLSISSDSLFINAKKIDKKLIVVENNVQGERLEKELNLLQKKDSDEDIIFIPGTEEMPYDMVDSDKFLSSKKNLSLIRYIKSSSLKITAITTAKNLQKKLIPKEILVQETLRIRKNDNLDLNTIKDTLVKIGYINNPQVNFHGEFSIRGSIVDIFPGGYNKPIRIDLNDIKIETIKYFDTQTQITFKESLNGDLYIVPMNNIILGKDNIINFRKKFREIFEGNPSNNNVYSGVSNGLLPQGLNNFFPLLFNNTENLFNYFDNVDNIIISTDINNIIKENYKIIKEKFNFSKENDDSVLDPNYIYLENNVIQDKLYKKSVTEIISGKSLDKDSYNFNISGVPDISIKPYLEKPINDLISYVNKLSCVVLFCQDNKKIIQFEDIFISNDLDYKIVDSLYDINLSNNKLYIIKGHVSESFKISDIGISFIIGSDIIKEKIKLQKNKNNSKSAFFIDQLKNLEIGSPVVHEVHGIGRYNGLKYIDNGGVSNEYLTILYEDDDKLYVPVSSLHLVNKYNTTEDETAPLHKLGGFSWSKAKKKATKNAYDIAAELLEINAKRALRKTLKYNINEFEYNQFSSEFIYDETEDQANAIDDVIKDLTSEKLMDRLVCGDVGFGKTEIALRAAFICASNFKQVVVLAPTTLLAEQHEKTFNNRFKNWPIKIRCLSRFKSKKEQEKILSEISTGNCNIIIGTHRVIQKDIKYKSLGLLIVDEEQKFGVKHKEFLKKLKDEVNVLTLTATPIPRTLNMSLGGLRDLSIIATSPENRMAIKTYTSDWKKSVIKEACDREINRGGQVFFLHNRVSDINLIYNEIQELMPSYSIKIAHAQMSPTQLEKIILEFYNKKFNILLSTTIIENGIDIANANTIIINKADKFGLSQLHQIRGRVGRSSKQAYCYLLVPDKNHITENAKKRLKALEGMEDLGSGFSIASRDLEIRGAGALLGDSQSGEIQEIGFSLYNRILSKAITALKTGKIPNLENPLDEITDIDINEVALIPDNYINDINQRLIMYKKIANSETTDQLDDVVIELINRFGNLPKETNNLIDITNMKIKYSKIGIKKLSVTRASLKISFQNDAQINNEKLIKFINNSQNNVSFTKDNTLLYKKTFNDIRDKKIVIANIINKII